MAAKFDPVKLAKALEPAIKKTNKIIARKKEVANKGKQDKEAMASLIMNIVNVIDEKLEAQNEALSRPKTIIRDANGKITGVK